MAQDGFQGLGIPALLNVAGGEGVPQGVGGKGRNVNALTAQLGENPPDVLVHGAVADHLTGGGGKAELPEAGLSQQLPPTPTRHVRNWVEMMARDLPNGIVGVDDLSNSGVSIDNAAEYVDILDAIYRSAREGCTVAL